MNFKKAAISYGNEVLKPSMKWIKQYWKEYTIFSVVYAAICLGPVFCKYIQLRKNIHKTDNTTE